jgi:hypothetical protein
MIARPKRFTTSRINSACILHTIYIRIAIANRWITFQFCGRDWLPLALYGCKFPFAREREREREESWKVKRNRKILLGVPGCHGTEKGGKDYWRFQTGDNPTKLNGSRTNRTTPHWFSLFGRRRRKIQIVSAHRTVDAITSTKRRTS